MAIGAKKQSGAKASAKRARAPFAGPVEMTIEARSPGRATSTVKFGSVTIKVATPSTDEILRNVALGHSALQRAMTTFVKPGIKLRFPKGVPQYHADPEQPGRLVRVLDGKRERGVFEDGQFKVLG